MAQGLKTGLRFPTTKHGLRLPVVPTALEKKQAAEIARLHNRTVAGEIVFFLTGVAVGLVVMFVAAIR